MANYGNVPQIDFTTLGDLGKTYRTAQMQAGRERSLAALGQGASIEDVSKSLFQAGDVEGGLSLAKLADAQAMRQYNIEKDKRDFGFQQSQARQAQTNADRSYGLQEKQFTAGVEGQKVPPAYELNPEGGLRFKTGGPADPAVIKAQNDAKIGSGLLDQPTVFQLAEQYRAGDTSVLTNLGRGAQGAENIKAIRQEVVRQNAAAGQGGADQASKNAEYFGVKSGQRTLGTKQANIELAATEFQQVLPVVQEASKAVNRTQYSDLNKIIQSYEQRTGDPKIVAFGGAVNTLVNLYSRAISPSGVPTVHDKEHAREILQKAWSQGQFDAAVTMMKAEIDAALTSPEKVRDDMRKRFLSGQGGATTPAHAPAPPSGGVIKWEIGPDGNPRQAR